MYPLALLSYLGKAETWGAKVIWAIIIVLAGYAGIRIVSRIVDRLLPTRRMPDRPYGTPKEVRTLATLIKSIVRYTSAFLVLGFLFKVFGIKLTPLLVSAGVVGLTIGFGFQNFIRDLISGVTLLFEKNLSVGDYVEIAGSAGVIEEIGIRTTKIRDGSGRLHILFNGNIVLIKNFTSGGTRVVLDVFLQKKEDVPTGKRILQDVLKDYFENFRMGKSEIRVALLNMRSPQLVARAEFSIIPLFQDLVSQQIVPRLKEVFADQAISLSANRIDATFVMRHPQSESSTRR